MTDAVLIITGERRTEGSAKPDLVTATIYDAEPTEHGDFSCRVRIPALFEADKQIFGVDEEQSKKVAAFFVRSLFHGLRITVCQEKAG